jgi:putative salt-induced outer membrane protein
LNLLITTALSLFALSPALAQTENNSAWKNESEVSVIQISGNSESESYSAKQKTSYTWEKNIFTASGRYIQTEAGGTESARNWEALAAYERTITEMFAATATHGSKSDKFGGYVQRDSTDLGLKYYIFKNDVRTYFFGASYGMTKNIKDTTPNIDKHTTNGKLNFELTEQLNESVKFGFKMNYNTNLNDQDIYSLDYEPALFVSMSKVLSLKVSQLTQYQNKVAPGLKKEDRTLTTAIVANF